MAAAENTASAAFAAPLQLHVQAPAVLLFNWCSIQ